MVVNTTRFGSLEINPDTVLSFPKGLIGLPEAKNFCLLEHGPGLPFRWLQSIDDPSLAMVVVDPYVYFPDYEVILSDEDSEMLKIQKPEEAVILTTVSIRKAPTGVTTNLLGPLVIGTQSRQAVQLVLEGDRYSVKQPLPIKTEQPDEKTLQRSA